MTFRVVVPYAKGFLDDRVVPAIENQGYTPELIECVNEVGHPYSYPLILRSLLLSGDDVLIIEQDNESRPGFIKSLEECEHYWCFFAYDFGDQTYEDAIDNGRREAGPLGRGFSPLGHTRFRAGVGEWIRETLDEDYFARTWVARDTFVAGALGVQGYEAHRHPGKCFHHHKYEPRPT